MENIKYRLRKVKKLDYKIDCLIKEQEDLRYRLKALNYEEEKIKSYNKSDLLDTIVKIICYEKEINFLIDKLVDEKKYYRDLSEQLESPYREVIQLYYFGRKNSLSDVADCLYYNYSYVRRVHAIALREMEKIEDKKICNKI